MDKQVLDQMMVVLDATLDVVNKVTQGSGINRIVMNQEYWKLCRMVREYKEQQEGYCIAGDNCVCGGDLPRVREGCIDWRKG